MAITWKDDPYIGDLDRFDPIVRLSVRFVVEHEHRAGGYAAGVGRDRVMDVLKEHWGGPIRLFDQQGWGRDVRVRTDFTFSDLCTMLGHLVVASSGLEATVEQMVLNMPPGPDWTRTQLVVDGFNASQMRERCARLAYQVLSGSLQDSVIGWLAKVEEAQSQRNELIHGQWVGAAHVADGSLKLPRRRFTLPARTQHPGGRGVRQGATGANISDGCGAFLAQRGP